MTISELLVHWRRSVERLALVHESAWREAGLPDVCAPNYWGRAASLEEVESAERRLGMRLPADYVELVTRHDAWPLPGFGCDGHFLSVASIGRLRELDPDVFARMPSDVNGPIQKLPISEPSAQPAMAADRLWLSESVLLTSDSFNNSDMVLLVPLESGGAQWTEYWLEGSRSGAVRFACLAALLTYMRDAILAGIPFQIDVS